MSSKAWLCDDRLHSRDRNADRLDGGTHVNGDFCAVDVLDTAVNCELN